MPAHPRLIGYLQRAVNHEFSALQQFVCQAVQAEGLGLGALAAELRAGAIEELQHAELFLRRLLALGAQPRPGSPALRPVGRSHAELLEFGMDTEADAVRLYAEAAQFCVRAGDEANRELFNRIRGDEERHFQILQQRWQALAGDNGRSGR